MPIIPEVSADLQAERLSVYNLHPRQLNAFLAKLSPQQWLENSMVQTVVNNTAMCGEERAETLYLLLENFVIQAVNERGPFWPEYQGLLEYIKRSNISDLNGVDCEFGVEPILKVITEEAFDLSELALEEELRLEEERTLALDRDKTKKEVKDELIDQGPTIPSVKRVKPKKKKRKRSREESERLRALNEEREKEKVELENQLRPLLKDIYTYIELLKLVVPGVIRFRSQSSVNVWAGVQPGHGREVHLQNLYPILLNNLLELTEISKLDVFQALDRRTKSKVRNLLTYFAPQTESITAALPASNVVVVARPSR